VFGLGTIVNVLAVLGGGAIGLFLRGGMNPRYQEAIVRIMGLSTIFIGAAGTLEHMLFVENGALTGLPIKETLIMILSMALGTFVGEVLDFDGKLEKFGAWLKEKATRGDDSKFIEGFVTASLTVCIGAMAIVGSIQDGLSGDPSTLFTKSILDFIILIIYASTYGKGALFSAIPVAILQGGVTVCAGLLAPVFSPIVIANLSFLGNMMIFCVGCNLAFQAKFRVANMLPALIFGALGVTFF
jgi:uncharacterized membrane protein YqgA involved in biofilm formation